MTGWLASSSSSNSFSNANLAFSLVLVTKGRSSRSNQCSGLFAACCACTRAGVNTAEPKYAYRATLEEIRENEFNLNVPRYVNTSEEEQEIDVVALQTEIDGLEAELVKTRTEMRQYLRELKDASK